MKNQKKSQSHKGQEILEIVAMVLGILLFFTILFHLFFAMVTQIKENRCSVNPTVDSKRINLKETHDKNINIFSKQNNSPKSDL